MEIISKGLNYVKDRKPLPLGERRDYVLSILDHPKNKGLFQTHT